MLMYFTGLFALIFPPNVLLVLGECFYTFGSSKTNRQTGHFDSIYYPTCRTYINLIKPNCPPEIWEDILSTIAYMKDNAEYDCVVCEQDLSSRPSICCDRCLLWYHQKCGNIKSKSKLPKYWICRSCYGE